MDSNASSLIHKDDFIKRLELSISSSCIANQRKVLNTSFSPERITECPRRLVYESINTGKDDDHIVISDNYSFIKSKWIERFGKNNDVAVVDKNVLSFDANCGIKSVIDCIINYENTLFVVNIQPVSNSNFNIINQKGAFKKHVIMTQVQIWLTELKNGLLIYENKDNDNYVIFRVNEHSSVINAVQKKCKSMSTHKILGSLPEKPYKNSEELECTQCEFLKLCWNKKEKSE